MRMIKIRILGNDDALVAHREVVDNPIRGAVPCGQHGSVDGLMPRRPQQRAQARRQMRVHQELHASTRCWLLSLSDWDGKSRQARRSSRSKSGNSSRRSSKESPAARYSSMDSTGYRRCRMAGFPWQISGSIVIRDSKASWGEAGEPFERGFLPFFM